MAQPLKFKTPTRVLTIRVPAVHFDKIKVDVVKLLQAYMPA